MKKIPTIISVLFLAVLGIAPAHAATYGATATPTSGLRSGDSVTLSVTGLTGTVGVYASVCKAGATQMDIPSPCDNATVSWITELGGGGSTAGSATFVVSSSFSGVDCTVDTCVIYVRGDHLNSSNYALIRAIPLSFLTGGPVRTADTATATYGTTTLAPNQAGNLKYRTPITLTVVAESGLPVTLSSLTGDCVVTGNVVSALIGDGVCAIAATTSGNDTYAPLSVNFPFYVGLGDQSILVGKFNRHLKAGRALTIPNSTIQSTFKDTVTLTSATPTVCQVKSVSGAWRLSAMKRGICTLQASAPASDKLWTAAARTLTIKVSSR